MDAEEAGPLNKIFLPACVGWVTTTQCQQYCRLLRSNNENKSSRTAETDGPTFILTYEEAIFTID